MVYEGKQTKDFYISLPVMLIGNAIGVFGFGFALWAIFKDTSVMETVNRICASRTTLASFDDFFCHFRVLVVEHWYHACRTDFCHNGKLIEFCHNLNVRSSNVSYLSLYTAISVTACQCFYFFDGYVIEVSRNGVLQC